MFVRSRVAWPDVAPRDASEVAIKAISCNRDFRNLQSSAPVLRFCQRSANVSNGLHLESLCDETGNAFVMNRELADYDQGIRLAETRNEFPIIFRVYFLVLLMSFHSLCKRTLTRIGVFIKYAKLTERR
jgi:hypothetical protein